MLGVRVPPGQPKNTFKTQTHPLRAGAFCAPWGAWEVGGERARGSLLGVAREDELFPVPLWVESQLDPHEAAGHADDSCQLLGFSEAVDAEWAKEEHVTHSIRRLRYVHRLPGPAEGDRLLAGRDPDLVVVLELGGSAVGVQVHRVHWGLVFHPDLRLAGGRVKSD